MRDTALALAGLLLAPMAAQAAQATHYPHHSRQAGAVLRYRFAAGEAYGYRLTVTGRTGVGGAQGQGATLFATRRETSGTVRYRILHVDAMGGATALVSTSPFQVRSTMQGQTTTSTLSAESGSVYLAADGSQHGNGSIDALVPNVQIPAGHLVPGARWTARLSVALPRSLPLLHVTMRNVLSGYRHAYGQNVAVITGTGAVQYQADSAVQGLREHLRVSGAVTVQTIFGLGSGRVVAGDSHHDLRVALEGQGLAVQERLVDDTRMRPIM